MARRMGHATLVRVATSVASGFAVKREVRQFRQKAAQALPLLGLSLRLLWWASPGLTAGIAAILVLQALMAPLQLALSRATIDRAALDLGVVRTAASTPAASAQATVGLGVAALPLGAWLALTAAALALGYLLQPLSAACQSMVGDRLTGIVTERLMQAANRWPGLARFEDPEFADDLERATKRAAPGAPTLLLVGGQLAVALVTGVSAVLILARLHPLLPLALVAAVAPQVVLKGVYQVRLGSTFYQQTADTRRLEYARNVLLTPEAGKDVRLFGLGPFFRSRYASIFGRAFAELNALRRPQALWATGAAGVSGAAAGAVYLLVVWLIARGDLTLGDLALYGGAATLLRANVTGTADGLGRVAESFRFLPSLLRVLDAPPDLPLPPAGQARPAPRPIRQGVVFEHVAFTYPGRTEPALRDVSMSIAPGECVALVGQNGAGKTTIVKLLLRLYDPCTLPGSAQPPGRILLDGVDLRAYDLADLRREMGVIFQDFVRYELPTGENIAIGQIDARADEKRVLAAAARAGADEMIRRLPQGLETPLGREFGGREISGGEWQKLALARAFVREAQVLVLDEPTAALDVPTEYAVFTRFRDLTRGRTTLLISHRFSTVRMADRILFLSDGSIQEEGSHDELLARGGEYARLYQLQAAQYLRASQPGAGGSPGVPSVEPAGSDR
jgi:ATP-binding cassette subfamily B protein